MQTTCSFKIYPFSAGVAALFASVVNPTVCGYWLIGSQFAAALVGDTDTADKFSTRSILSFYTEAHSLREDLWPAELLAEDRNENSAVQPKNQANAKVTDRIKAILATKGLTLYQVSQKIKILYGRPSPYFLPHNFYYDLGLGTFTPSLSQMFALSKISGYRFYDWLSVFGFNPEDIVRLQVLLPSRRTIVLDSSLVDPESWIPWFQLKSGDPPGPPIAPLGQLLNRARPKRIRSAAGANSDDFIYAKIGLEDALAFPELLPGSIVRAPRRSGQVVSSPDNEKRASGLCLIEHTNGFRCCRLRAVNGNHLVPLSRQLPYAQVELELPGEVAVLGLLDLEIRSLLKPEWPEVPKELARHWRPAKLLPQTRKLSQLLRQGRLKAGLSFREASAMSRSVAAELGDEQYFIARGSLSDYEASETPPRHAHKAITLCAIYGLVLSDFLDSIGLRPEEAGQEAIPDPFILREHATSRNAVENNLPATTGDLPPFLSQFDQLPFFLRRSMPALCGLATSSLNDFFWVGGEQSPLHPVLINGLLVIVNRHRKKAFHFRSRPLWQQPIYILLKRDGAYVCGCCSQENGLLILHPYSPSHLPPEHLRNHHDAEVIGQVVTVARKL